jgi:hypothetical protein
MDADDSSCTPSGIQSVVRVVSRRLADGRDWLLWVNRASPRFASATEELAQIPDANGHGNWFRAAGTGRRRQYPSKRPCRPAGVDSAMGHKRNWLASFEGRPLAAIGYPETARFDSCAISLDMWALCLTYGAADGVAFL